MATAFSSCFVRLRKKAGFKTAYQYYNKNGGRDNLKITFANYMNIEHGRVLPAPETLRRLVNFLQLPLCEEELGELILSYLRVWIKKEETFQWFMAFLVKPSAFVSEGSMPIREALRSALRKNIRPLDKKQQATVIADEPTYWCFTLLNNDKNEWLLEQIEKALGFSKTVLMKSLQKLKNNRLIKETKPGIFKSLFSEKSLTGPQLSSEDYDKMRDYWKRMSQRRGTLLLKFSSVLQASETAIRSYIPYLREAVHGSTIYATPERARDSALFVIHAQVSKLLDVRD